MEDQIKELHEKAVEEIEACDDLETLGTIRNAYLSKKSPLMALMSRMKELSGEARAAFGKHINDAKNEIAERLEAKRKALEERKIEKQLEEETIDISLPGKEMKKEPKILSIKSKMKLLISLLLWAMKSLKDRKWRAIIITLN